jgi:hypothetical protein
LSKKFCVRNLNQACTKNMYDVTEKDKHMIPSGDSYEIFDSLKMSSMSLDILCGKLQSNLKGVYDQKTTFGSISYTADTDRLLKIMEMNLPDAYGILKKILSKNTTNKRVMVIQSQNDASFNTLGMLRVYSKSNIPDLESLMYSASSKTLRNKDDTNMCTIYQTKNSKFVHVQMMGVGYWMAKQNAELVMSIITSFWSNELLGKASS